MPPSRRTPSALPPPHPQATYDEMSGGRVAGVDPSSLDSAATVFLAFNPGFTCPDYDWSATLDAIAARWVPAASCGL